MFYTWVNLGDSGVKRYTVQEDAFKQTICHIMKTIAVTVAILKGEHLLILNRVHAEQR